MFSIKKSAAALGIASAIAIGAGIALPQSTQAAAVPVVRDLESMKREFAKLLQGSYSGKSCTDIPDMKGIGLRPGTITVTAAGDLIAESTRLSMFDQAASFALTKYYGSRGFKRGHGFSYSVFVGPSTFSMSTNLEGGVGLAEAGRTGGTRNVTEGMSCHSIDLSGAKIAPESYDLNEFLVPIFDTGGAFVEGRCISDGKHKEARTSRFRLSAAGVQIDEVWLAFDDARNPIVMSGIGSRFSDGTLNGDFTMKDGSGIHMERRFSDASNFVNFSYSVLGDGDKSKARRFFCSVRQ